MSVKTCHNEKSKKYQCQMGKLYFYTSYQTSNKSYMYVNTEKRFLTNQLISA